MKSLATPTSDVLVDHQAMHRSISTAQLSGDRRLLRDYWDLTKPRIVTLVLLTVSVGFLTGARGATNLGELAIALVGTGLVAAGGSVWNQVVERSRDRLMKRTARRPIPSGRISVRDAAVFGIVLGVAGVSLLSLGHFPLAAVVALISFVLYGVVYTLLKPRTTLNTAIGAVPGALPPVIGWTAATGELGIECLALFLIVFLWQFPHFLAIAWIHRDDYAKAGHRMLPCLDPNGTLTGRQATIHAMALVPAGLLPTAIGLAGPLFFVGSLGMGLYYLATACRFWQNPTDQHARGLLKASFLHLPVVLILLLLDPRPL